MGVIIITHDLGVVAQICDEVEVMYAGRIVERGTVMRSSIIRSTNTPRA
jgi:ABC-type dipeptide/oligopeptide/nickel transport system ATPase component